MSRLGYGTPKTVTTTDAVTNTPIFTDNATGGVVSIPAPTGGVAQFKGLAQGTSEDKYVLVNCIGLQPMFYTTAWRSLAAGTGNGFMLTCFTGISNCV